MTQATPLPKRVVNAAQGREQDAALFDLLVGGITRGDPLMDAVVQDLGPGDDRLERALRFGCAAVPDAPPSLVALIDDLNRVAADVDLARLDRGGELLLRTGVISGIVLSFKCLLAGYTSPAGNKPLAFSGRLKSKASRRLNETARFVQAVVWPGGMHRFGAGFLITVQVRRMHAQVRRLLLTSGKWDHDAWSLPINQHDMMATILLFSSLLVTGLRQCGVCLDPDEIDDYVYLWRHVGRVIGVDDDINIRSQFDGEQKQAMIHLTQGIPDEDSVALTHALLSISADIAQTAFQKRVGPHRVDMAHGMARFLLGDEMADHLRLRDTRHKDMLPKFAAAMQRTLPLRSKIPLYDAWTRRAGKRYWHHIVNARLAGRPALFRPPIALDALRP